MFTRSMAAVAAATFLGTSLLAAPASAAVTVGDIEMSGNFAVLTAKNGWANKVTVWVERSNEMTFQVAEGADHNYNAGPGCEKPRSGLVLCRTPGGAPISANIMLGDGSDSIYLSGGDVRAKVYGDAGDDKAHLSRGEGGRSGPASVAFFGGTGEDTAGYQTHYDGPVSVYLDNRSNDGRPGLDTDNIRSDVETLVGSPSADKLNGNASTNRLVGGYGADEIYGNGGDDYIDANDGGSGDRVNCGEGSDKVVVNPGDEHVYCEYF
jgi:hypothetical protein